MNSLIKNLPHVGDKITCPNGAKGEVIHMNVLRQLVKVVIDNGDTKEIQEFKVDAVKVHQGNKQNKNEEVSDDVKALELLEKGNERKPGSDYKSA